MIVLEFLAACAGTVAFALLFSVPKQYYPACGFIGGCGWVLYRLLQMGGRSITEATLFATILVVFLSRVFAIRGKCPVTVFLISGIFPLVPGTGIYWTAYYVVTNELTKAGERGFSTLKIAAAIVFGIILVIELPQKLFRFCMREKKQKGVTK